MTRPQRATDGAGGATSSSRSTTRGWWLLGGILAATVLLHGASLRAPFVADDYLFLEQVQGRSLVAALASPDPIGNFLRPVSRPLYFWLVSRLAGARPVAFHAVNLGLFLALVTVLFLLARRLAGERTALFAAAFLAFHYAADVPLLWASGSQDLLATLAGVTAIYLQSGGHRAWAAVVLGVGLLSKEHIAVVPLIAVLAQASSPGGWRPAAKRAWPLFLVTLAWAIAWLATVRSRPAAAAAMSADPSALPAALWHLALVAGGLEAGAAAPGTRWGIVMVTLATAVLVVGLATPRESSIGGGEAAHPSGPTASSLRIGVGWAVLGTLPIAAVASIWSAYFYLFALCGAAMALGTLVNGWPAWFRVAAIVILGIGSAHGRQIGEFATSRSAWSAQSHVNRFYLERAMGTSARFIGDMKALRPSLPPMSTVFFADLPPSVGLQTADGPVIRFAYGDRTLRSYYLTDFSEDKARRGPLFFFAVENDTLRDHSEDPAMLASAAYSMILSEKPGAARAMLELALERAPEDPLLRSWLGWTQWATGDTAAAVSTLARVGILAGTGPAPELEAAAHPASRDDTTRAIAALLRARSRHGLSPQVHARLAALGLASAEYRQLGVIAAFVYTRLRPQDPDAWRKWASAQLSEGRYEPAARSLERYFSLGGEAAQQDLEARQVLASLRRLLPGGDVAQEAVRGTTGR